MIKKKFPRYPSARLWTAYIDGAKVKNLSEVLTEKEYKRLLVTQQDSWCMREQLVAESWGVTK